jgi:hypothetical protein
VVHISRDALDNMHLLAISRISRRKACKGDFEGRERVA